MKKMITPQSYLLVLFITFSTVAFSQTIINYQTWTGASGCNIFGTLKNVPATINGASNTIPHLTAIGQPTYDNTDKSVNLACQVISGSQYQGTEYRTTVNFKMGYSYKITINAARIKTQQTDPDAWFRLDLNNGGSGNNTLCNGTGIIDPNGGGGFKQILAVTKTTFDDYIFNYTYLS